MQNIFKSFFSTENQNQRKMTDRQTKPRERTRNILNETHVRRQNIQTKTQKQRKTSFELEWCASRMEFISITNFWFNFSHPMNGNGQIKPCVCVCCKCQSYAHVHSMYRSIQIGSSTFSRILSTESKSIVKNVDRIYSRLAVFFFHVLSVLYLLHIRSDLAFHTVAISNAASNTILSNAT